MPILIKQNHTSFVVDRYISNNIVIAKEAVHSMRNLKGKKAWMALKIDLEKAYDKVRWDFLRDTLLEAGFPNLLVSVILNCVSSTSYQVL